MSTGARLRRARLDRGLTLDQVSDSTKIQLWILHAIERDELSHVPGGVFIRGYLAAFAREVGVDANEILTEHFGPPPPPAVTQAPDIHRPVYTGTPLWQAAALVVLVIATAVVWGKTWREDADTPLRNAAPTVQRSRAAAPKTDGVAATTGATTPPAPVATTASAVESTTSPVVTVAKSIADATPSPIHASEVATTSAPSQPSEAVVDPIIAKDTATPDSRTTDPGSQIPDPGAALAVDIHATGEVWIEVLADGQRKAYRLFKPGEQLTVDAQKEVHLVIGDASAATYTVNGAPSGPLGGIGVVREITLTP